jgi:hypothetical protein
MLATCWTMERQLILYKECWVTRRHLPLKFMLNYVGNEEESFIRGLNHRDTVERISRQTLPKIKAQSVLKEDKDAE